MYKVPLKAQVKEQFTGICGRGAHMDRDIQKSGIVLGLELRGFYLSIASASFLSLSLP